ncbi:putative quinol monooxygenase [Sediminibacillus halophilus]|uniref:Quinol monooxygenase YgiN n=1 Tax=Sediminibacillus halophilus TaxID=482461 RepID=A0A1G9RZE0_9BACI|nr:antibiotic biosynthesis monooxygenase [Sediminibacillus halophilus]SDM28593.1 Quinol monooxygenase YgiN [Sediminibacillus halophilus]
MSKFGLYGKFTVNEGERDNLVEILLDAAKEMEELEECEIYLVNTSDEEPNAVFVYEVWSKESAHRASLSLEATQTLIKRAKPIITDMERISSLRPRGGKH